MYFSSPLCPAALIGALREYCAETYLTSRICSAMPLPPTMLSLGASGCSSRARPPCSDRGEGPIDSSCSPCRNVTFHLPASLYVAFLLTIVVGIASGRSAGGCAFLADRAATKQAWVEAGGGGPARGARPVPVRQPACHPGLIHIALNKVAQTEMRIAHTCSPLLLDFSSECDSFYYVGVLLGVTRHITHWQIK
jgi:hypothetical protein